MADIDLGRAEQVLNLIAKALDLAPDVLDIYLAVVQIAPHKVPGFMGFVSNRKALALGLTTGVPGQPNSVGIVVNVDPSGVDPWNGAFVAIIGTNETFNAKLAGGTGPFTYFWQFGDGSTSEAPAPVHSYRQAAIYSGSLIVTDALGATGSIGFLVEVTIPAVGV